MRLIVVIMLDNGHIIWSLLHQDGDMIWCIHGDNGWRWLISEEYLYCIHYSYALWFNDFLYISVHYFNVYVYIHTYIYTIYLFIYWLIDILACTIHKNYTWSPFLTSLVSMLDILRLAKDDPNIDAGLDTIPKWGEEQPLRIHVPLYIACPKAVMHWMVCKPTWKHRLDGKLVLSIVVTPISSK